MEHAIEVEGLRKAYGATVAVDGVSFAVDAGEIFGIVGPNGSGKTTTVECIQGLRRPDAGHVRVLGLDPQRDGAALRRRIGTQLQECNLPERLKVGEAIDLFAAFYGRAVDGRAHLARVGLEGRGAAAVGKLSGGQKQRLFVALALVHDPEVVFLDKLSTGLDPQARHAIWDLVRGLRERGTTVVLTTHFMDEAERLCDRVAIVDRGRVLALDTPRGLVSAFAGAERGITVLVDGSVDASALQALPAVTRVERADDRVTVWGGDDRLAAAVVGSLERQGRTLRDLRSIQPTLEDVFLSLTGRPLRE